MRCSTRPPIPGCAPRWRATPRRGPAPPPPRSGGIPPHDGVTEGEALPVDRAGGDIRPIMPALPTDGFAGAEFIVRHLYRPVPPIAGEQLFAAAETAQPIDGDTW